MAEILTQKSKSCDDSTLGSPDERSWRSSWLGKHVDVLKSHISGLDSSNQHLPPCSPWIPAEGEFKDYPPGWNRNGGGRQVDKETYNVKLDNGEELPLKKHDI